jgi:hypothetical protein
MEISEANTNEKIGGNHGRNDSERRADYRSCGAG